MSSPICLAAMKTDKTAVRSLVDVTRAISANRAAPAPEPRPSTEQTTYTSQKYKKQLQHLQMTANAKHGLASRILSVCPSNRYMQCNTMKELIAIQKVNLFDFRVPVSRGYPVPPKILAQSDPSIQKMPTPTYFFLLVDPQL